MTQTGIVMNIQRYSLNDGPGIRTTVFLKGCPLRCAWCHNPESWRAEPQTLYYEKKCAHCGACERDPSAPCLYGARVTVGTTWRDGDLVREVLRDERFFARGGGVTFSGGEALMQPAFTASCLSMLRARGIHTCVDTSLFAPEEAVRAVAAQADLVLADLKAFDPDAHRRITGADNAPVLQNLRLLSGLGTPLWVRMPLARGVNDDPAALRDSARFLMTLNNLRRVDLLPVLNHASEKYRALGLTPPRFNEGTDAAGLLRRAAEILSEASGGRLPIHEMI